MRYLGQFLLAVGSQWVWLMSSLVSLALAVWQNLTKKPFVNTKIFWALACFCVFLAFFFAWKEERVKTEKERKENAPDLVGEILAVNRHPLPNGEGTGVLLVVKIKNRGADSIAEAYRVSVVKEGKELTGVVHLFSGTLTLQGEQGTLVYSSVDQLFDKTSNEPIRRGAQVTGVAWAWFPGFNSEEFDADSVALHFVDVTEKAYVVRLTGAQAGNITVHFPGLSGSAHEAPDH